MEGSGVMNIVSAEGNRFVRAQVPDGNVTTRALLNRQFDAVPKKVLRYEFSLRIAALPTVGAQTMRVSVGRYPEGTQVVMAIDANGIKLFEQSFGPGAQFYDYRPTSVVPLAGRWTRIALRLVLDVSPRRIELRANGDLVFSTPTQTDLEPKVIDANAGIGYSDPSPDLQVDIDDAALYVE